MNQRSRLAADWEPTPEERAAIDEATEWSAEDDFLRTPPPVELTWDQQEFCARFPEHAFESDEEAAEARERMLDDTRWIQRDGGREYVSPEAENFLQPDFATAGGGGGGGKSVGQKKTFAPKYVMPEGKPVAAVYGLHVRNLTWGAIWFFRPRRDLAIALIEQLVKSVDSGRIPKSVPFLRKSKTKLFDVVLWLPETIDVSPLRKRRRIVAQMLNLEAIEVGGPTVARLNSLAERPLAIPAKVCDDLGTGMGEESFT